MHRRTRQQRLDGRALPSCQRLMEPHHVLPETSGNLLALRAMTNAKRIGAERMTNFE